MGIARTKKLINLADIVIFMIDGSVGIGEQDRLLFETVAHKKILLLVNKLDLMDAPLDKGDDLFTRGYPLVTLSAKKQMGLDALKKTLFSMVSGDSDQWQEEGCAPNMRHKQSLQRARQATLNLLEGLEQGLSSDLLAIELQESVDQLSDIVGETTTEDVLDVIFEQFCLGK